MDGWSGEESECRREIGDDSRAEREKRERRPLQSSWSGENILTGSRAEVIAAIVVQGAKRKEQVSGLSAFPGKKLNAPET